MKKLLLFIGLLFFWFSMSAQEAGMEKRKTLNDDVGYWIYNLSSGTAARAGFGAVNDTLDTLSIFVGDTMTRLITNKTLNVQNKMYIDTGAGGMSFGTNIQDASALISLNSTTKGFLIPRQTTVQRDLIPTPATGLLIFNTTANRIEIYDGSVWVSVIGTGVLSIIKPDTVNIGASGVSITSSTGGTVTTTGIGPGSDEGLKWNYDTKTDTVAVTSSTSVTTIELGTINIASKEGIFGINGSANGKLTFIATDNDQADITINTLNQMLFQNAKGYGFNGDVIITDSTAFLNVSDSDLNLDQIYDTSTVAIRASDTPEIRMHGVDGDEWKLTINTSDAMLNIGATGGYNFDNKITQSNATGILEFIGATSSAISSVADLTISTTTNDENIAITPNGVGEVDISKVDIDAGAIDGTTIGAVSAAPGTFTNVVADSGKVDVVIARSASGLKLYEDGGNGIFIKDAGDVGIRTLLPEANLHVTGTPSDGSIVKFGNKAYSGNASLIDMFHDNIQHNDVYGIWMTMRTTKPTAINSLAGIKTALQNTGDANVADVYGFRYEDLYLSGTSSATDQFGLWLADLDAATNNYGIYSLITPATNSFFLYDAGGAKSYFSGNVGIGTSVPGGALGLRDANTYIDRDGSNNMTFTDAVTGTKTLAELATGVGTTIQVDTIKSSTNSTIQLGVAGEDVIVGADTLKGSPVWDGSLTAVATITGATLTDGTLTTTSGTLTGGVSIDATNVSTGTTGNVTNYLTTKIYNDSTVTGETTLTNVIPAGYYVENIIFKNTTANLITNLDFGFSDAGGEVVAAANLLASDEGSFTILQRTDDFDAADTLYISADNWNSASLVIYIIMKRAF